MSNKEGDLDNCDCSSRKLNERVLVVLDAIKLEQV